MSKQYSRCEPIDSPPEVVASASRYALISCLVVYPLPRTKGGDDHELPFVAVRLKKRECSLLRTPYKYGLATVWYHKKFRGTLVSMKASRSYTVPYT